MSNPDFSEIDFGADARVVAPGSLQQLTHLVAEMELAEAALIEAQAVLAQRSARLKGIVEHELPDMMQELKQPILHTSDGRRIEVKGIVRSTLPEARRPLGHQWLIENGHGGNIKRTVEVAFAAVEGDKAEALMASMASEFGHNARQVMKVESSTLSSFVRKQLEREADPEYKGARLPQDIFEVREFKHAKVSKK